MNELQPNAMLESIIGRRRIASFLVSCIRSLAFSLLISSLSIWFLKVSYYWAIPLFCTIVLIEAFLSNAWKVKTNIIINFLDRRYVGLEESSGLLLKLDSQLSGLEVLQKRKVARVLADTDVPFFFHHKPYKSVGLLVSSLLVFALAVFNPLSNSTKNEKLVAPISSGSAIKENIPAAISNFRVVVTPPAYTQKENRSQEQFNLKVESEALVEWRISTTKDIKNLTLLFNNKTQIKMLKVSAAGNEWSYKQKINKQGFYQVDLDGIKSELYQIAVIPDLPVRIKITTPKPRTVIDIGQPQSIVINTSMQDDYGISSAFIAATMASGKGEGVSFTEKKLPFNFVFRNQKTVSLKQTINLKSLGMKPGDELYFYVSATDNHNQQSRSDVYFVSIVDTTELMSLTGMSSGVNLVPEYFRSQRQIIIDTEKLLKEQAAISEKEFKTRSNDIGVDQKLLRLRYGKFLGEESETEIGADHEHQDGDHDEIDAGHDEKAGAEKFGDVKAIMDQYAHKHDVAEDVP